MKIAVKWLFVTFPIVLAACGGTDSNSPGQDRSNRMSQGSGGGMAGMGESITAIPVSVDTATINPISARITSTTTLEAEKAVEVVAKVSGVVKRILVEEGRTVGAEQALAQLDDAETKIQVMEAKARAENAASVYRRSEDIYHQNLISKEEFENAKYQMEIAQAQLETAELRLKYTTIRAPIDGMVTERLIDPGAYVTVNSVVYRMADYDPILARVRIPEKEMRRIKLGQTALVEVESAPGRQFEGQVDMISPIVDPQSGTVKVTVKIHGQDHLLMPGMFAKAFIVTDVRPKALVISKKALILEGDIDYVYVYEDGIAHRHQVRRGYEESNQVEVVSGLNAGERVITVGAGGLRDGMAVYVPGEQTPTLAEAASSPAAGSDGDQGNRASAWARGGAGGGSGRTEGGFTADPERMKRFEEHLLQNPEIRAAYDKKLKEDPGLKKDQQKRMAFLRELMQQQEGTGRPPAAMNRQADPGRDRSSVARPAGSESRPAAGATAGENSGARPENAGQSPGSSVADPGGDSPAGPAYNVENMKQFESMLLKEPEIKAAYDRKLQEDPEMAGDINKRVAFLRQLIRQRGGQPR